MINALNQADSKMQLTRSQADQQQLLITMWRLERP